MPPAAKKSAKPFVPPLDLLDHGYCGDRLERSQAATWANCASVQLREHRPKGVISLAVQSPAAVKTTHRRVRCCPITEAMLATFPANATETISFGACGIATHLAASLLNIEFSARAREGDGFDFFFHDRDQDPSDYDLFEGTTVIEVSGINEATPTNSVAKRAREKAEQARSRHEYASAYAIVVEFATPQALVVAA